ncbi:transmembrane protein 176 isoform X1 [Centropristis striata]|uniref:transmembrane protein 176 isoform X1 n=1 Tax=Centropristis striata TaxID=184440 RepID=UPI0027E170E3|nr:transmembrane protein 176 isoform X1 [Centropristis striata]XP_059190698.1 transmembrane protein 176 isoform X1 [Centropristis striata]
MAVAVTRDLTLQVQEDVNAVKLTDRQQALRAAIQKGEPKCLGVSQVMLGLLVMSYSIPLHFYEATEVVRLGVPWWSGLTFITAGTVAIILDKHSTIKILQVCLIASIVSAVLSVVALIIYSIDIDKHPGVPCSKTVHGNCFHKYYATHLSRGLKSSLLVFTLAQAVISAVVCFLLFRQRRSFGQYASLMEAPSPALIPPELN